MLSKKIFTTLRRTTSTSTQYTEAARLLTMQLSSQQRALTYLRASQFACCSKKKNLTEFTEYQQNEVMAPVPTTLAKPTLRNTKVREAYSD